MAQSLDRSIDLFRKIDTDCNVYCACSRRCSCAVVVLARRFPHLSRGQRGADAGCGSRNPRAAGARDGDAVSARPRSPRSAAAETRHFGRVETDAGAHAACSRSRAHARGSCTRMSVPVSGVQWSSRADSSEARDACRFSLHRHDVPALLALVPYLACATPLSSTHERLSTAQQQVATYLPHRSSTLQSMGFPTICTTRSTRPA